MSKYKLDDLQAFVTVARVASFTKAAAQLGITQSALSQTINNLEAKLQIRLLTRTTRNVAVTQAGEKLLQNIASSIDNIEDSVTNLLQNRANPAGTVRITCSTAVLRRILLPKIIPVLNQYPDINVEFDVTPKLRNIVTEGFDAGVRLGEAIDKDMIAIAISPKTMLAAVATPAYFSKYGIPKHPQDLLHHNCINWRLSSSDKLYVWEFEKNGKKLNVRVPGQLILNSSESVKDAVLSGFGIAVMCEDDFYPHITNGSLVRVLEDWCPKFDGYHLYYPSRKQHNAAFGLIINALKQ